jgi:hypothetical protein
MAESVLEIVEHFGAASYETQRVEGHWRHSGMLYRDDLVQSSWMSPTAPGIANGCDSSKSAGKCVWSRWSCGW